MLANTVQNDGTIKAYKGSVHLTGASEATINLNGNSIVSLTVNKGVLDALVENKGVVIADGGKIYLTTNAVDELLKGVVNNTGIIEAKSLDDVSSEVILFAHGGTANVSGTIEAIGGFVETSGRELQIDATAKIQADTWLLDPINVTIGESGNSLIDDDGGLANNGSTVSASAIMAALATTDVFISTYGTGTEEGNIYVNSAITYGGTHGLSLQAYNDININADITVNESARLELFYGINISTGTLGNRGGINLKMNGDHTAFDAKVTLNGNSRFFSVGDGGSFVEYTVIRNRAGLEAINTALDGKYVLGGDIDLSGSNWLALGSDGTSGGNFFTGRLNALGHTISHMKIEDTNPSSWGQGGLFYYVGDGSVSNLALTSVGISGAGESNGALAGVISNADISNIILQGSVKGNSPIARSFGGLTGASYGTTTINNVHADIAVEGNSNIGGLIGFGSGDLTITNSSSKGDIKLSGDNVGGLVGYFSGDALKIEKSFNGGDIGVMDGVVPYGSSLYSVGGLVGYLESVIPASYIRESFNTGDVTGYGTVGGVVGYLYNPLEISNTYNSGRVTGIGEDGAIGGFIGDAYNSVVNIGNSYNMGDVVAGNSNYVGGFIGDFSGGVVNINNSFTQSNVTGSSCVGGLIGSVTTGNVNLNNVSVNGAVNGTSAVGGVIGTSGFSVFNIINLALTNVSWSSEGSGQDNAIGSSFAGEHVLLSNTETGDDEYISVDIDNSDGMYAVDMGYEDADGWEVYEPYNYDTHYDMLSNANKIILGGTSQTGDFTDLSASGITTAQNGIIGTISSSHITPDGIVESPWVSNPNINNGLPYLDWHGEELVVQVVKIAVNTALTTATTAKADTLTAIENVTTALTTANGAVTSATTASGVIDTTVSGIEGTTSLSSVQTALSTINTNVTTLTNAKTTATTALATATTAKAIAVEKATLAQTAYDDAITAGATVTQLTAVLALVNEANSAVSTATTALTNAQTQVATLDSLISAANTKLTTAQDIETTINNSLALEAAAELAAQQAAALAAQQAAALAAQKTAGKDTQTTEKIIATIINNQKFVVDVPKTEVVQPMVSAMQVPKMSMIEVPTKSLSLASSNNLPLTTVALKLGVSEGESVSLVSSPENGQHAEKITLAEISQMQTNGSGETQNNSTNVAVKETRVALGGGSLIELVDGGVSLPDGVDQEFYAVKSSKGGNK